MEQSKGVSEEQSELILNHLKFAEKMARQFYRERKHFGIELEEFIAAARFGLCDAALRFDARRNDNFRTFSYFRIRGAMYDLLKQAGGISRAHYSRLLPSAPDDDRRDAAGSAPRLPALPYTLAQDTDDLRRLAAIIEDYGIRLQVSQDRRVVSLSYAKPGDPETLLSHKSTACYLRRLVGRLPEREREIIEHRYFGAESFDDMRPALGDVSRSWLSRLHGRALTSLREMIIADNAECRGRVAGYEA